MRVVEHFYYSLAQNQNYYPTAHTMPSNIKYQQSIQQTLSYLLLTRCMILYMKQQAPHRVQFDLKTLQYYSYLRTIVQSNELSYWIGNPSVSIINGSIALQPLSIPIDHYQTYIQYLEFTRAGNIHDQQPQESFEPTEEEQPLRSQCLVLCGIPNSKNPVQIIENSLFGQYRSALIEMRVIKTVQLRYYAMLLRFKNKRTATDCFNDLFGREYNEIEMERIVLREMEDITLSFSEITKDGEGSDLKILRKASEEAEAQRMPSDYIFMSAHHLSTKLQLKQPQAGSKLSCAICLEEINQQIISILCGHYFHCECLQRWEYNTCPLCRYHQQPPVISFCEQCNQCEGLWVCLICGLRLCCGSSNDILAEDSHIYQHYKDTNHSLSMQLQTKFIFDARVPAFLHQMFYRDLIQKGAGQEQSSGQKEDLKKNKLSDKIAMYQGQVAEEMQKQRAYFQEAFARQTRIHRDEVYKKKEEVKNARQQLDALNSEIEEANRRNERIAQALQQAEKEERVIAGLQKMYSEKMEKCQGKISRARKMQRDRLDELQQAIQQKKAELLNYKSNLGLQQRLRTKLKGETIESSLFLMQQKPKRKRK